MSVVRTKFDFYAFLLTSMASILLFLRTMSFCAQFTWQPNIYPNDSSGSLRKRKSRTVIGLFLCSWWKTWSYVALLRLEINNCKQTNCELKFWFAFILLVVNIITSRILLVLKNMHSESNMKQSELCALGFPDNSFQSSVEDNWVYYYYLHISYIFCLLDCRNKPTCILRNLYL